MMALLNLVVWVLNLFGFGKKDERDAERAAGEKLGKQEVENTNAQEGLDEVQRAIAARDHADTDSMHLTDRSNPSARRYEDRPD